MNDVFKKGDIMWFNGFGYLIHKSMTATTAEVVQKCKRVATRAESGAMIWLGDVPPGWSKDKETGMWVQE